MRDGFATPTAAGGRHYIVIPSTLPDERAWPLLSERDVAQFRRHGYLVLPLFAPESIDAAKAALRREAEPFISAGDTRREIGSPTLSLEAAAYEDARQLIFSADLISVVQQLLTAKPIYFGDSSVSFGDGYTGWHRDNRQSDRRDGSTPDWRGDYDLIRVGIYLQDCADHSGGLLIRAGSHRNAPGIPRWAKAPVLRKACALRGRFHGQGRFVDSRKGDVVLWSLRSIHAGHGVRLKLAPHLVLDPKIQPLVPERLRVPLDGLRMAVFATFARPGEHYDRYRVYLRGRDYFANRERVDVRDNIPGLVEFDDLRAAQP